MAPTYADVYERSIRDPEGFWGAAAQDVFWYQQPTQVFDSSRTPFNRWFADGVTNNCYNALDLHVEHGRGDQAALVYDSPVTGTQRTYSYRELRDWVAQFAGALVAQGVVKGDRVLIYMPAVPETIVAMLACARIGAVHSVVFGGFASHELAVRIDDATPKVIVSASCGIEVDRVIPYKPLLDGALELARNQPDVCIILQRPQAVASMVAPRDLDWDEVMESAQPAECVPLRATDPLYVLYTSGTTGKPKGVVRDNGGHLVAMKWSMSNLYGVAPGQVFWAASDLGWQVGHSYIVYGPLLHGCTTILFEGKPVGTPDAGAFWRVIEEHRVNVLFTAPTAFRAIRREDPEGALLKQYDLSSLQTLFLAGERSDTPTIEWAERLLRVPVIDHYWQTETGWPAVSNPVGIELKPVKLGSAALPVPGYAFCVLDEGGQEVPAGTTGNLVARLPLPPGCLMTLWDNDEGFIESYMAEFPGYYKTADAGMIDEDGYIWVMGRTDDIINVAAHRLSTATIEEVVAGHPDIAECAIVGAADDLKGQVPIGLLVLKAGVERDAQDIVGEVIQLVRDQVGAVVSFRQATVIKRLPKTRSGKVLRGTIRRIADRETYTVPATIDDPAVLAEIEDALEPLGYGRARGAAAQGAIPEQLDQTRP